MADKSPVEIVRSMLRAQSEGRIDDMLALIDPDVIWFPSTRPGRSMYRGRDEVLRMMEDFKEARGDGRAEFDEIVELADGSVSASGHRVVTTNEGDVIGDRVEIVCHVYRGLILTVDSVPADRRQRGE